MIGEGAGDYQRLVRRAVGRGTPEDFYALGCLLTTMRLWGAAAGCFARVVAAEPENAKAWTNYGWCTHLIGDSQAAWGYLNRAIEINPKEGMPHALICQAEAALGDLPQAVASGRRGVELDPEPVNRLGFALALMNAGEWEEGWREYESRFEYRIPELLTRPYKLWRGETVKTLYIECEQGYGDSIFAARWFPVCFERSERTIVFCQKELYTLFNENFGADSVTILPLPRPLPDGVDAWCPSMSIPAALGVAEVGSWEGYLNA